MSEITQQADQGSVGSRPAFPLAMGLVDRHEDRQAGYAVSQLHPHLSFLSKAFEDQGRRAHNRPHRLMFWGGF
jgi:hypothetical protein